MTNEIRLAFAHPAERAAASVLDTSFDRISLRDYTVSVEIGAFQLERGITQRVCFNVVVEVRPLTDEIDDDVDRILSYDRVTEAIDCELAAERLNLLETLAERIADRILLEPQAMRVFVRIEKLDRGPGALGVEIVRSRDRRNQAQTISNDMTAVHPRIIYLTNSAIVDGDLCQWLDHLETEQAPTILCVGLPDGPRPVVQNAAAQRRVDLLAIEQNAWRLAALDKRCVVVATRTELDWAMKHDQISVWAPSKMILDATHPPAAGCDAPEALAAWLAGELQGRELVLVGSDCRPDTDIPVSLVAMTAARV